MPRVTRPVSTHCQPTIQKASSSPVQHTSTKFQVHMRSSQAVSMFMSFLPLLTAIHFDTVLINFCHVPLQVFHAGTSHPFAMHQLLRWHTSNHKFISQLNVPRMKHSPPTDVVYHKQKPFHPQQKPKRCPKAELVGSSIPSYAMPVHWYL